MKSIASTFMLVACLGASTCGFAQSGSAAAPAAGTTNPNNPSAIPPNPPSPATPTTNGNLPIGPQNPQMPINPQVPPTVGTAPVTAAPEAQVSPTIGTTAPVTAAPGSVNMRNSSGQIFASMDRSQKGYLSTADVASNKFLASHFQQCDSNSDGRLTQTETDLCLRQMSPGEK